MKIKLRHIRHANEKRAWDDLLDQEKEYEVRIKAKRSRSSRNLLTNWDDIWRYEDTNWKKHRDTQYRDL